MKRRLTNIAIGLLAVTTVACSRETKVYSDPQAPGIVTPVSTDGRNALPKDFYNQSVNQSSVEIQLDAVTATSKAVRFQTIAVTNSEGGFNGSGLGNRALVGLGSWHSRPVAQAEPVTFDARIFNGTESIGVNLQIDLKCDGTDIRVVNASGSAIAAEPSTSVGGGYTRLTASQAKPIWLSPTAPIIDPSTATVLVPMSGAPASLGALLAKYPAACLKNASTSAVDLPRAIPTAAILWSLGSDSTTSFNSTFVRRFTVGSEVFEGLE